MSVAAAFSHTTVTRRNTSTTPTPASAAVSTATRHSAVLRRRSGTRRNARASVQEFPTAFTTNSSTLPLAPVTGHQEVEVQTQLLLWRSLQPVPTSTADRAGSQYSVQTDDVVAALPPGAFGVAPTDATNRPTQYTAERDLSYAGPRTLGTHFSSLPFPGLLLSHRVGTSMAAWWDISSKSYI